MTFAASPMVYAPVTSSSLVVISHAETSPMWPDYYASRVEGCRRKPASFDSVQLFGLSFPSQTGKKDQKDTFLMAVSGARPLFAKQTTLTRGEHD